MTSCQRLDGESDAAYAARLDIFNHGPDLRAYHRTRLARAVGLSWDDDAENAFQQSIRLGCFGGYPNKG